MKLEGVIKQCIECGVFENKGVLLRIEPQLMKAYEIDHTYLSKECYLRSISGGLIGWNEEDSTITLPAQELGILQNIEREQCTQHEYKTKGK